MFNSFQIITHLPLINLSHPDNTILFFTLIVDISNYNFIPMDNIYDILFTEKVIGNITTFVNGTDEASEEDTDDEEDDYPINYSFKTMGYSKSFIVNIGNIFLFIIV